MSFVGFALYNIFDFRTSNTSLICHDIVPSFQMGGAKIPRRGFIG
ncbi:hypothetical protein [Salmonella phage SS9]|uniref:Uncharacterized protein n=1 Tax=Salmonella phage SS9 TaxID=2592220 RepID=A0A5C0CDF5_9CAUD|nr:hypothetical protein HYP88_gp147 [Salmonella phage SS9]QEI24312.1 hypothetical protein [Salmonella phage SS9]